VNTQTFNRPTTPRVANARAVCALIACGFVSAACSLSQPYPAKGNFTINPPSPTGSSKPDSAPECIQIDPVSVAPPYGQQSFVYRVGDNQFQTDYYNQFISPPNRLLTGATVEGLARRSSATTVLEPSSTAGCALRLEVHITDLYADLRPGRNLAIIRARFMLLRDTPGTTTVLGDWSLESAEPLLSPDPPDIAAAYGRGYSAILSRLAKQLAAVQP